MRKSKLARTIEYWIRQAKRVLKLLVIVLIIIIILIVIIWFIPILIEVIQNVLG